MGGAGYYRIAGNIDEEQILANWRLAVTSPKKKARKFVKFQGVVSRPCVIR